MYSAYSSLLFLMFNMLEMSSIIYANKYCKMTSFSSLRPFLVLLENPVAIKKKLVGCSFKESSYKACPGLSPVQCELSEPLIISSLSHGE